MMTDHKHTATQALHRLRQIAAANGLPTIQAWADKAGMKRQQISDYVNGRVMPDLATFMRITEAAGAEVEVISTQTLTAPKGA